MASDYDSLPPDDEAPAALLEDARDYMRTAVPGWQNSDGALDDSVLSSVAQEGATLYALLREIADDFFRDIGEKVYGVPTGDPVAASTTTTWVARSAAPPGGYDLPAGTTIAVEAPQGLVGFEVIDDQNLPEGDTTLSSIPVRCLEEGTAGNGATGDVQQDSQLAWVLSVTVDAPATGGSDGQTAEEHSAAVVRKISSLSTAALLPRDLELLALESDEVERCLVRDLWDEETSLDNQERTASLFPVDIDGQPVSAGTKTEIEDKIAARRPVNFVGRVADPTYTTVDVEITVARTDSSIDAAELQAAVEAAIVADPINPARFGLPLQGDKLSGESWRLRTVLRRYEIGVAADLVAGVDYVTEVKLCETGGTPADADLSLSGSAPLPEPGTITVNVVDAT